MVETHAPSHISRKSGYLKALKVLFSNECSSWHTLLSSRKRSPTFDKVDVVAVCILKEDQPIAGILIGLAGKFHSLGLEFRVRSVEAVHRDSNMPHAWGLQLIRSRFALPGNNFNDGSIRSFDKI